mmetsp:Transcript_1192/g.3920  ORF Transcript_1192/g.3920 Transcript_1192/m.3920 type:complete len:551 (-) Transcript_1192:877-2529(-)
MERVGDTTALRVGRSAAAETPCGAHASADTASSKTSPPRVVTANKVGAAPGASVTFVETPPGVAIHRSLGVNARAPPNCAFFAVLSEPLPLFVNVCRSPDSGVAATVCAPGATKASFALAVCAAEICNANGHPFATTSTALMSTTRAAGAPGRPAGKPRLRRSPSALLIATTKRSRLVGGVETSPPVANSDTNNSDGALGCSLFRPESSLASPNRPTACMHRPIAFPSEPTGTSSSLDGTRGSAWKIEVATPGSATPVAATPPSTSRTSTNCNVVGVAFVSTTGARATSLYATASRSASTPTADDTSVSCSSETETKRTVVSLESPSHFELVAQLQLASQGPFPAAPPSLPTGTGHAAVGGTSPLDEDCASKSKAQTPPLPSVSVSPNTRKSRPTVASPPTETSPHPSGRAHAFFWAKPSRPSSPRHARSASSPACRGDCRDEAFESPINARLRVHRRRRVAQIPLLCDPRGGGHRVTHVTPNAQPFSSTSWSRSTCHGPTQRHPSGRGWSAKCEVEFPPRTSPYRAVKNSSNGLFGGSHPAMGKNRSLS